MAPSLEFWFEFASTYSYISAMRIEALATAAGVSLEYKPFLLGPIFAAQGWNTSPFNIYELKGRYMWRDVERIAHAVGLPFKKPSTFPRNGLLAARVAFSGELEHWCPGFVRGVYQANFEKDEDISDSKIIGKILAGLGLDGARMIQIAQSPDNKERFHARSTEATSRGVFGAPSFVANGELFWGNDRLEDALRWASRSM